MNYLLVTKYNSGVAQHELIGSVLYELLHDDDRYLLENVFRIEPDVRRKVYMLPVNRKFNIMCFSLSCNSIVFIYLIQIEDTLEVERQFFVRIRCMLAKRNAGLTDQGYKVCVCN
jgi:hypothetical protein